MAIMQTLALQLVLIVYLTAKIVLHLVIVTNAISVTICIVVLVFQVVQPATIQPQVEPVVHVFQIAIPALTRLLVLLVQLIICFIRIQGFVFLPQLVIQDTIYRDQLVLLVTAYVQLALHPQHAQVVL